MTLGLSTTDELIRADLAQKLQEFPDFSFSPSALAELNGEALIGVLVGLDAYRHPRVDPNDGWVELEAAVLSGRSFTIIDTQLQRLYFSQSGALQLHLYKPRRCCLTSLGQSFHICSKGEESLAQQEPQVLRRTPGLMVVRFLNAGWIKEVSVKAGIGAYVAEATTGFELELYRETAKDDAVFTWNPQFPTGVPDVLSAAGLLCFGAHGISRTLENPLEFGPSEPGGTYGVKLTDALYDIVCEYRFSRALPLLHVSMVEGNVYVSVPLPAGTACSLDDSLKLFVSVVS